MEPRHASVTKYHLTFGIPANRHLLLALLVSEIVAAVVEPIVLKEGLLELDVGTVLPELLQHVQSLIIFNEHLWKTVLADAASGQKR